MKRITMTATIILLLTMILISCRKETNTNNQLGKKQFALSNLFKNLEPQRQKFTVDASTYRVLYGSKGTKLAIPVGSFKKANGQTVSSGFIEVELMEMLTGGEMIKANKTTTSRGRTLISGGQDYLMARQNGEELQINKSNPPIMRIPTNNPQPMQLFNGTLLPNDSIDGDTLIDWSTVDSITNPVRPVQDSSGVAAFQFTIDSVGYINCDYFYNSSNLTRVFVQAPFIHVDSNTVVFIYFPAINSVARLWGFDKTTNTFSLGNSYQCPSGINAKIIMISKVNTQYYFQKIPITVTSNMIVNSNPAPVSESAIEAALDNL